jgi:hypothetical protein
MSSIFSLAAQRCGLERRVTVEADGLGITVGCDGSLSRAGSTGEAIQQARQHIGEFLQPAQRGQIPWGLMVSVSAGAAAYGEWPLAGTREPSPSFENSPLARIHSRWHDSGPLSALENAIEIIRAYTPRRAVRLAA